MADVEYRRENYGGRGYHGGGGGGGGGGGRKRRFREDDDYDRNRYQRPRREEPLSQRVRRQVWNIGEDIRRDAQNDVMDIARTIADNYEDDYFRGVVAGIFTQLIYEQPMKIPFAAGILVEVNEAKPEMAALIIDKLAETLQDSIQAGLWRQVKLNLRLLGLAQNVFEGDGVFAILDELFSRAVDLQAASPEDTLGLEVVKIIMLTVPYILAWHPDCRDRASELLEKTAVVASSPHDVEKLVVPYLSRDNEALEALAQDPAPSCPGMLALLQEQLQNEEKKGFELKLIPRFAVSRRRDDQADGADGEASKKHSLSVTIPDTLPLGTKPIFPEVWYSLYADQEIETVPPTSDIASTLIRDVLVDTINILDFNRNAVGKFLIDMDGYFTPRTFARRATPFDKIKDLPADEPTWKCEDLIVDAIFSQMLRLPSPEHKVVYYHSLITETCRIAPAAIAPSLGRAIRFLYRSLDRLDLEVSYRFMDWFAQHLSNFDFRWKWAEWLDDVSLSPLWPRKAFVLGVLDKEVRLSFARRIRETLPEDYHRLIPAKKDNDIPEFKYNDATTPYSEQGKEILGLIKRKAPEEDLEAAIASFNTQVSADAGDSADPTPISTDAFVTALCHIGSKSLSHVLSFIERYRTRLLALSSQPAADLASPDAKVQVVSSVVSYWQEVQPGVAVNIVDKLLNYSVVSPSDVCRWALASSQRLRGGALLCEHWIFELLSGTLTKVARRVRQVALARLNNGAPLPPSQASQLEATLEQERKGLRDLHALVDQTLTVVAQGQVEGQTEAKPLAFDEGADRQLEGDQQAMLLRLWGSKWKRVFARSLQVQDTFLDDIVTRFPAPGVEEPEVQESGMQAMEDVDAGSADNGIAADTANNQDQATEEDLLM